MLLLLVLLVLEYCSATAATATAPTTATLLQNLSSTFAIPIGALVVPFWDYLIGFFL